MPSPWWWLLTRLSAPQAAAGFDETVCYFNVSKKAAILVASSSVRPTFGISVPGFRAAGLRIHFLRSSGPELLTAPPAILGRLATPARFGPTVPVAPGMPGIVWQPTQGLVAMI